MSRSATIKRVTGETNIELSVEIDGAGCVAIATGHAFFDHMMDLFAKHSLMNISLNAEGDLDVDAHHTVEDVAIVLGDGLRNCLGDKRGITRYAHVYLPMDETLCRVVMDLSNRPYFEFRVPDDTRDAPNFSITLVEEFFRAFANNLRCNLHIELLYGRDGHHVAEAIFKGVARCFRAAAQIDPRASEIIPSTKGII